MSKEPITWTGDKPTVQGFWWMKRLDIHSHPFGLCKIRLTGESMQIMITDEWQSLHGFMSRTKCRWAGPLEPPHE